MEEVAPLLRCVYKSILQPAKLLPLSLLPSQLGGCCWMVRSFIFAGFVSFQA